MRDPWNGQDPAKAIGQALLVWVAGTFGSAVVLGAMHAPQWVMYTVTIAVGVLIPLLVVSSYVSNGRGPEPQADDARFDVGPLRMPKPGVASLVASHTCGIARVDFYWDGGPLAMVTTPNRGHEYRCSAKPTDFDGDPAGVRAEVYAKNGDMLEVYP